MTRQQHNSMQGRTPGAVLFGGIGRGWASYRSAGTGLVGIIADGLEPMDLQPAWPGEIVCEHERSSLSARL